MLGNRASPNGNEEEGHSNEESGRRHKMKSKWNIKVDRVTKYIEELDYAKEIIKTVDKMDYDEMKSKGASKKKGVAN